MVCRTLIFSSLLDCFPNCMFFIFSYLVASLKIVQVHICNLIWGFFFFHSLVKLKLQLNEEGKIPVRK